MSIFFNIILILFLNLSISARDLGETEITTDDGIEVYQNEKYYLLKKNVKIDSDNFILNADNVRINFKDNLNDITELDAKGRVKFNSSEFKMKGSGESLKFIVKSEKLEIEGRNSELITQDIQMYSNGLIKVNNLSGDFLLFGENSKLINESVTIIANSIDGIPAAQTAAVDASWFGLDSSGLKQSMIAIVMQFQGTNHSSEIVLN